MTSKITLVLSLFDHHISPVRGGYRHYYRPRCVAEVLSQGPGPRPEGQGIYKLRAFPSQTYIGYIGDNQAVKRLSETGT